MGPRNNYTKIMERLSVKVISTVIHEGGSKGSIVPWVHYKGVSVETSIILYTLLKPERRPKCISDIYIGKEPDIIRKSHNIQVYFIQFLSTH